MLPAKPLKRHLQRSTGRLIVLLGTVVVLLAGACPPIQAALLRDVRIGEYDTYTRIVFEFSAPMDADRIETGRPDLIFVSFDDALPDLKRKIAIGNSPRIAEIRLYHRQATLFAQIHLRFMQSHFKAFKLDNPPRLVLDFFLDPATQAPPSTPPAASAPTEQHTEPPVSLPASKPMVDLSPIVTQPMAGPISEGTPANDPPDRHILPSDPAAPQTAPLDNAQEPMTPAQSEPSAPAQERDTLFPGIYLPAVGDLQFTLWSGLLALIILILACLLLLRILARRESAALKKAANEMLLEDQEPIIELTDRVETSTARVDTI